MNYYWEVFGAELTADNSIKIRCTCRYDFTNALKCGANQHFECPCCKDWYEVDQSRTRVTKPKTNASVPLDKHNCIYIGGKFMLDIDAGKFFAHRSLKKEESKCQN